ncbi:MAG: enoyl-CoA hydratase [Deltaproteobacteria bacterium]|nr:enoyl-CoA hydratase [Deltaproteobacteria bacterium]
MSSHQKIRVEVDGPVATLTLDRPEKLNAMDVDLLKEMLDATKKLDADDTIRVVILTGAGRSFCAGADLSMRLEPGRTTSDHLDEDHRPALMAIAASPKPWISAIRGAAAGVGSAYMMACDLTVMAEDAYLYQAFAALGLIPDGGATWHLTNTIGRKRAYELIATGEKLPAARCLELGLCNRVVPTERLLEETRAWAEQLAERAPLSLRYAKAAVWTAAQSDLPTSYDREVELQELCAASEDGREGAMAFLEKRQPAFKGR